MLLIKDTVKKLIKKNITVSVAESCSGGIIANSIIKFSGASKIFSYGLICYSNKAKNKYLSISKQILLKHGAVSSQVAREMINNLYKKEKTNIVISTTGIAGPNGSTKNKPVGLVYIGIKFKKTNYIFKKNFSGSRIDVQKKTRDFVFRKVNKLV